MTPDSSQLLDSLRAVRQRWRLVLLLVAVSTGLALVVSLSSEKQYDATAQLLLRGEEPIDSILATGGAARSNDPERDLNTEIELITVGPTALDVKRRLKLDRSVDALLEQVEATSSNTSNIVRLRVRDPDPALAARIANTFAQSYVRFRVNSSRQRYLRAAQLAERQLLALSDEDRRSQQGRDLQSRQRELQIASALQTGGAELVRRADVPGSPSRPRPKVSAALGGLLGLLFGVGAALGLNLVDRRFRDEQDVERFFELPILAGIPRPMRRAAGRDDAAQQEAYGLLAANLRLASARGASSVVMVTSPSPGDGKTSVTLGVARAYARLGLSVIAIEADLRRPAFSRYADVSSSDGLTGVLAGSAMSRELIWLDGETLRPVDKDAAGNAAVGLLPAGDLPANPQRALSDPGMSLIVEVARSIADVVLIDTAPVGTVNDATMLASQVEGVIIVARLNQTTKDAGRRAVRTLAKLRAEKLGVVVTDAAAGERHGYYVSSSSAAAPGPGLPPAHARSGVQGGVD
jgi:capsular exopolysaccharide synthesis family protein